MAPQDSKIAVEILQSVNNPTQNLREILRMVIIDTVINTLFRGLTLDPAGMHCPSWDDAFVSSCVLRFMLTLLRFCKTDNAKGDVL